MADLLGESREEPVIGGLLTVPTLRFQVLYVFLVLAHERRRDAFPWDSAPRYLLRDRDRIFGDDFSKQVQDMAIEEVLSAPRSPWQRAYVERVMEKAKVGPLGDLRAVSLSPDEKIVAYYDSGRGGIWLRELIRGVETRFTFPPVLAYAPVWSPVGGRIAFASSGGLYRKDASGGGQEELPPFF